MSRAPSFSIHGDISCSLPQRNLTSFTSQFRMKPFPKFSTTMMGACSFSIRQRATSSGRRKSSAFTSAAAAGGGGVPHPPLDLTEENVRLVLAEARGELGQLFDGEVGITGQAELAELDGPFVKISLKGRFWHERSMILARLGNYLQQRIPEILEVEIEDEKMLDDSPANF
ncbi:unnamed protein product [Linum trigynum]